MSKKLYFDLSVIPSSMNLLRSLYKLKKWSKRKNRFNLIFILPLVILVTTTLWFTVPSLSIQAQTPNFPTTRDVWLWPFTRGSIWNLPLGSNAIYQPANLPVTAGTNFDNDLLFQIPPGSPLRRLYNPGSFGPGRCTGTATPNGDPNANISIPIPDDLIVPDATATDTPNNAAALLQPDGVSLVQLNVMARCNYADNVYGVLYSADETLYTKGIYGGHGGSGLSSIGGTIRKGELTSNVPIYHALKINLWGNFLNYNPASPTPGYRWPAWKADTSAPNDYQGTNPELVMGSLLALPPDVTVESLGLTTKPAKKLLYAFQNYGAYVVDNVGGNTHALAIEKGVEEEFNEYYNYNIRSYDPNDPWFRDFMVLFQNLNVITNNTETTIGGGGRPRRPLAPPLRQRLS